MEFYCYQMGLSRPLDLRPRLVTTYRKFQYNTTIFPSCVYLAVLGAPVTQLTTRKAEGTKVSCVPHITCWPCLCLLSLFLCPLIFAVEVPRRSDCTDLCTQGLAQWKKPILHSCATGKWKCSTYPAQAQKKVKGKTANGCAGAGVCHYAHM